MNATATEPTFEDMAIDVPEPGQDREIMPSGIYNGKLVGLKTVAKPDWMLNGEDEDEDREQWQWTWEIVDGDWQGQRLSAYTNRSWHEKANAHKYAAALLGVPTLPVGVGMSTGQLAGKTCQLWITERAKKNDPNSQYNKVDKVTPTPSPRMRSQRPSAAPQGTKAGGRVQLDGFPTDQDEVPFDETVD
jgi:hypothetical protein